MADRYGHEAEYHERLLNGFELGHPKADGRVCQLPDIAGVQHRLLQRQDSPKVTCHLLSDRVMPMSNNFFAIFSNMIFPIGTITKF